jgi:outer membrane autotransporter protein
VNAGELTLGIFLEHGEGDYSTSNSFANAASVHGKGNADYTGGGLLAHLQFNRTQHGEFHAEASARLGKVDLDFRTRDLVDAFGRYTAYDSSSRYAGAHVGLGYVLNVNERSSLKLYGQALWSRQGADTVRLSTGEPAQSVRFAAVDSHRIRLGARWNRSVSENGKLYLGAAWERETDGKSRASIDGYRPDTPELKGNTGLVEAGFTLNPATARAWTLDIGVQGYAGQREGVTGSLKVNYRF